MLTGAIMPRAGPVLVKIMTMPRLTRWAAGHDHFRADAGSPPSSDVRPRSRWLHRAATPLELLYDLTFVVAFGVASEQFAHLLAEGHLAAGLTAFVLAVFAICWAWINFSWFASAYDTDDWAFRLATMVQMVGVIILALGLPQSSMRSRRANRSTTASPWPATW